MTRPWQKTIDFVDGLKRKLPDEELAVIKRYVEKRSREASQVQMTAKCNCRVGGTQIIISWYGSQDARTTGSPERGDMGSRTNHRQRFLDRGRGFKPRGRIPPTTECVDTQTREKSTRITADTTFLQQGYKTFSEQNKRFDPRWEKREGPALEGGCSSTFFFWGKREGSLLVFCLCPLCARFSKLLIYPGETSQQAERCEGRHGSSR